MQWHAWRGGSAVRMFSVRRVSPVFPRSVLLVRTMNERCGREAELGPRPSAHSLAIIATKQNNNELVRQEEGQRQQQRTLRGWRRGRRRSVPDHRQAPGGRRHPRETVSWIWATGVFMVVFYLVSCWRRFPFARRWRYDRDSLKRRKKHGKRYGMWL